VAGTTQEDAAAQKMAGQEANQKMIDGEK